MRRHEAQLLEQFKARALRNGGLIVQPIMGPHSWKTIRFCDAAWCFRHAAYEWIAENGMKYYRCYVHPMSDVLMAQLERLHHADDDVDEVSPVHMNGIGARLAYRLIPVTTPAFRPPSPSLEGERQARLREDV